MRLSLESDFDDQSARKLAATLGLSLAFCVAAWYAPEGTPTLIAGLASVAALIGGFWVTTRDAAQVPWRGVRREILPRAVRALASSAPTESELAEAIAALSPRYPRFTRGLNPAELRSACLQHNSEK